MNWVGSTGLSASLEQGHTPIHLRINDEKSHCRKFGARDAIWEQRGTLAYVSAYRDWHLPTIGQPLLTGLGRPGAARRSRHTPGVGFAPLKHCQPSL